jgi:glycerophosphoryl diester phosphodiesterase
MKAFINVLFFILISSMNIHSQDICKKFFRDNPVVAHRGAWKSKGLPQNSIAALREAMSLGCAGSEFDVHMTADSVFVLSHDNNWFGKLIERYSYDELAKTKLSNGETLPTLEQAIMEGMKQTDTRLFLEIKSSSTVERTVLSAKQIVNCVNTMGAQPWVFYISFDYDAIKAIRLSAPTSSVAYLNGDRSPEQLKADNITGLDYNLNVVKQNPSIVETAKKLGLSLNVWTVNAPDDMDVCLNHHFDYITTDEPELLLKKDQLKKVF